MAKKICRCERCGCKKAKVDIGTKLLSYPPKYAYDCPNCGEHGFINCDHVYDEIANSEVKDENPRFALSLDYDGDITIRKYVRGHFSVEVYHKTYNPGEDIRDNLLEAYKKWEELNNVGC